MLRHILEATNMLFLNNDYGFYNLCYNYEYINIFRDIIRDLKFNVDLVMKDL
jgi:hypothetical protein